MNLIWCAWEKISFLAVGILHIKHKFIGETVDDNKRGYYMKESYRSVLEILIHLSYLYKNIFLFYLKLPNIEG